MRKKLILLIIVFSLFIFKVNAEPINSNFKDDNFYQCVIENLNEENINENSNRNLESYNVTDDELSKLTTLSCISYQINDITGIEKIINLNYLDLEDNNLTHIDLSNNKSLTYVFVDKKVIVSGYEGELENAEDQMVIASNDNDFNPTFLIIFLVLIILILIELYLLFIKLNEKGWKAIIPIYNYIVLIRLTNQPMWYIILLFIPIVNIYIMYKIGVELTYIFNKTKKIAILFAIFPIVGIFFIIIQKDNSSKIYDNKIQEEIPDIIIQKEPLNDINNELNVELENLDLGQNQNEISISSNPNSQLDITNKLNENKNQITQNNDDYQICSSCGAKLRSDVSVCFMCGNNLK